MAIEKEGKHKRQVDGTITTISFRKSKNGDGELIAEANVFVNLPEHRGIRATSLLRNFFVRKLKEANNAALERDS